MVWKLNRERVQKAADRLLALVQVQEPPVIIEQIAQRRGVEVRCVAYEHSLSGLLLWEHGSPVIGVNALHTKIRQRFAIAHELAHLELRHFTGIHIDRMFPVTLLEEAATRQVNPLDIEASAVAIEVLMPVDMLRSDLKGKLIDYLDEKLAKELADRYQVGEQTMLLRLMQAGFISWESPLGV
ncbi:MAG TPA: ImmA/IrrE family metallo-endopeptidase [Ktedonobacteraceae bacterium]|jgi:Zn-dependent peptidase ImmA (M78 family)|nr:ImmA/IrrE family metallo-endopeptidase [Ktedonobacteraceae bacterium]